MAIKQVIKEFNPFFKPILVISILGLALRLILYPHTFHIDLYSFELWSNDLYQFGFKNFYSIDKVDYPPGYLYVLWITAKFYYWMLASSPTLIPQELLYKLPSMIADVLNAGLIYLIVKTFASSKKAFVCFLFSLFNPAFILDSTLWGQIDSFLTFFLLLSFYLLITGRVLWSALALSLSQIIKPFAIFSLPFYLIFILRSEDSFKKGLKTVILACAIFFLITTASYIPFVGNHNFLNFLLERQIAAIDWFGYLTLNSFNFWAPVSIMQLGTINKVSDEIIFLGISFGTWGRILFGAIFLSLAFITQRWLRQSKDKGIFLAFVFTILYIGMFLFLTRIRERHLYFGLSYLIAILPLVSLKSKLALGVFYLTFLANLYFSYHLASNNSQTLDSLQIIWISLLNLSLFGFLIYLFLTFLKKERLS